MDLGLDGRRALITGGSRGIGLAIAKALVAEGAEVSICGRDPETLGLAAKSLGDVHTQQVDMADSASIDTWVGDAAEALGGIDIVISNVSGLGGAGLDAWRRNFEVDVIGYVHLVQAALPRLEASDAAAIVAIGTTAAVETFGGNPAGPYGALKAATIHHTSGLAQTLAPKGIRANTVSPGPVYFEGGSWETIKDQKPEFYESILGQIPRGSMGSAEEIASVVAFLASPAASLVTGVNVVADGGLTKKVKF
ncbi:SDR family oxidoreductase [Actinomadura sp. KC345]|uniref:SDR family NAD(P)-dependent oxidoreductase n=1 Tax=Actinomadura sp. KC345 TaxID=2530371 RepID=UPI00104A1EC1|nr:SDR family oxidoreductase [Actinomadura sp. KC345]TDC55502.1 SDR family oxidoreductase [Actinomadura sp. KC345]